jgi:hypothetical protein
VTLALVAGVALTACAPATRPQPAPPPELRVVRVPVPVPCVAPPLPQRPRLALASLPAEAGPAEVLRAYLMTCEQLAGYARELETIAGACGTPTEEGR